MYNKLFSNPNPNMCIVFTLLWIICAYSRQANSKVEMYEQKCQELDVEVSALRQESRQEEQMHKKLSMFL